MAVKYNRSKKQYEIKANREVIATFPKGPENKYRALFAELAHINPQIYLVVKSMVNGDKTNNRRIVRGGQLVASDRIQSRLILDGFSQMVVRANEGNVSTITGLSLYTITHNLIYTCDCKNPQECSHIAGLKILEVLQAQKAAAKAAVKPVTKVQTVQEQIDEAQASLFLPKHDKRHAPWHV